MSESLRDQLLKSGLAKTLRPEPTPRPSQRPAIKPQIQKKARHEPAEIDLTKAYALRDKEAREQREREQRAAEQRAREKKERRQKLATLLNGKASNAPNADIARHFPHVNKIRRMYVTADQLPRLNGGQLAIVQFAGRYLLVEREIAVAAQAIDAESLVLLCDGPAIDEDGVPADLIW